MSSIIGSIVEATVMPIILVFEIIGMTLTLVVTAVVEPITSLLQVKR